MGDGTMVLVLWALLKMGTVFCRNLLCLFFLGEMTSVSRHDYCPASLALSSIFWSRPRREHTSFFKRWTSSSFSLIHSLKKIYKQYH